MKTKTVTLIGVLILVLVLGVGVKMFFFPFVSDAIFQMNSNKLKQAPANVVLLRPTHFPKSGRNGIVYTSVERKGKSSQWIMGRNVSLQTVIATAYSYNAGRVSLPPGASTANYDFLVTTASDPEQHLQSAIRHKLGYTADVETRDTPVMALKVEDPNSQAMKVSTAEREDITPKNGRLYFTHVRLSVVTDGLEGMLKTPVVDKTGMTNFYDFSLLWDSKTAQKIQSGTLDEETGRKILTGWGLGLEPDTASIEMLVVKK
jgi:uncharacterized protein (TIGR03435 family)